MSDLISREDVLNILDEQTYCCDAEELIRALPAVQPDAVAIREAVLNDADYDAGLLNDFGGGNVNWWQDYLRAEIGRANEYWRALIDNAGKEVMPDEIPRSNAKNPDTAPAGLSAGGGAG